MQVETDYPRHLSAAQVFEECVDLYPDLIALKWADECIAYRELNRRANQLAHYLRDQGVGLETPVAFYMEPSPNLFVAILAIIKAGGSYLPLDITYPEERLDFMVRDAGVKLVLTDANTTGDTDPLSFCERALCLTAEANQIAVQSETNLDPVACGDSRIYIMYTSGSTGTPKGIEILHRGVVRLARNANYIHITEKDRVGQVANPAFDAFTMEVWIALLNGAQLTGVDRKVALSPDALAQCISEEKLTFLFLTAALLNHTARECPDAFKTLRYLASGGEAMNPTWVRKIMEHGAPEQIVNLYGPTESTVITTYYIVNELNEDAQSVPIGMTVSNTDVYLLNADNELVDVGEAGEICIGGDAMTRGYLNRPELNDEKFIPHPKRPGERLYRSGDLGHWREDGAIEFMGRADGQVKIRGFRVELTGIESVILKDSEVEAAAAILREDQPGHKQLVAYVVPRNSGILQIKEDIHSTCVRLREFVRVELPHYMVPSAFILIEHLPLTPNRKIDHKQLPSPHEVIAKAAHFTPPVTPTESRIERLWCRLLDLDKISIHTSFIQAGGDSLMAAQLLLQVEEEFGIKVPAYEFLHVPTIAQLARQVDSIGFQEGESEDDVEVVNLTKEAVLDPGITPSHNSYTWRHPKNVFLTGATGFLGAYLIRDLIVKKGVVVYALVRAENHERAMERIQKNLQKYDIWDDALTESIHPVCGDLTQPHLGLNDDVYNELANCIDAIYHNAAHVSYVEPYAWHKPVNVTGTIEMIQFAFAGSPKVMHYISTLGLFGPIGLLAKVTDVYEDDDIGMSVDFLHFDMGYSQSKWVAEAILFQARDRGLALNIFRPGFIMGDSESGICNVDDFMARLVIACINHKGYPVLKNQRKECIPVDYASHAIVHISHKEEELGKNFHLAPLKHQRSVSVVDFFELVKSCGYPMEAKPYGEWVEMITEGVSKGEDRPLLPLMSALTERIYHHEKTRWELHENMPAYHADNTAEAMSDQDVEFPYLERPLIAKYLAAMQQGGYIPAQIS